MEIDKAYEDLAFIKQMINASRKKFENNGVHYIIIGTLFVAATALTYLFIDLRMYNLITPIWIIFILSLVALHIWRRLKSVKSPTSPTFGEIIYNNLLMSITAVIIILYVITIVHRLGSSIFLGIMSIVLGLGYYVSGVIMQSGWMKALSFGWAVGGIVIFFLPDYITLLFMAIITILFELIPGIIMYATSKKGQ